MRSIAAQRAGRAVLPCAARRHASVPPAKLRASFAAASRAAPGNSEAPHAQSEEALRQEIRGSGASMAAAALPFAAATMQQGASGTAELYFGLAKAVDVYLVVLTVRVLLSWFRNINWFGEPFNTLRQLTDPFLNVFRGIVPPISGVDLSPMIGFFALNFLRNILMGMVSSTLV